MIKDSSYQLDCSAFRNRFEKVTPLTSTSKDLTTRTRLLEQGWEKIPSGFSFPSVRENSIHRAYRLLDINGILLLEFNVESFPNCFIGGIVQASFTTSKKYKVLIEFRGKEIVRTKCTCIVGFAKSIETSDLTLIADVEQSCVLIDVQFY
jgi:hypothetical protein